MSIFNVVILY